ncbi:MAG TPA: hypothetical protein VIL35_10535, partial [Vicinamibacterales bacterium]
MIDWSRAIAEHRRIVVVLGVAAAINLAFYLAVVFPMSSRASSLEARAQAATTSLAKAQAEFKAAEAARVGAARAEEQLARFYEQILPRDQAGARRITYLRLATMADAAGLHYEGRQFNMPDPRESTLQRLEMNMSLEGDYRDVRRFIHELETAPEFVV